MHISPFARTRRNAHRMLTSFPPRQPTPWRMAELEEVMHTAENRQVEQDMVQAAAEQTAEAQAQVQG